MHDSRLKKLSVWQTHTRFHAEYGEDMSVQNSKTHRLMINDWNSERDTAVKQSQEEKKRHSEEIKHSVNCDVGKRKKGNSTDITARNGFQLSSLDWLFILYLP